MRCEWRGRSIDLGTPSALALAGVDGRDWYAVSGDSIGDYSDRMGLDWHRVVDVVAILSPRVSVSQNVKLAREYLETGAIRKGVMRQRMAALWRYESDGIVRGPKVSAFARALRGDGSAVVVDAWMLRAFAERPTPKGLAMVTRRIRGTAGHLGWPPAETQAALWVGMRRACGFVDAVSPLVMT